MYNIILHTALGSLNYTQYPVFTQKCYLLSDLIPFLPLLGCIEYFTAIFVQLLMNPHTFCTTANDLQIKTIQFYT